MNLIFYFIIFLMGITFGSFYTLAVYRIPKRQDIVHTHSYCPKCNHKLGILDLMPVFSYIFLGGKCRYCKDKIRPRYLILEILSGIIFVALAYLIGLNIYDLHLNRIIEFGFFILYLTFIILISAIEKENKQINKSVLMYGIIISIIYIVYLYMMEKVSIYRYVIYLFLEAILLIIDTISIKKKAEDNYVVSLLLFLVVMAIFTGEFTTIMSIIAIIIALGIYIIIKRVKLPKNSQEIVNNKVTFAFYISIFNILYFIFILVFYRYLI